MRHMFLGFALGLALIFVPAAEATPLDLHRIPADAAGVGHLDVDAFRASSLMKMLEAALAADKDDAELVKAKPVIAQLEKNCSAITLWLADSPHPAGAKPDDKADTQGVVMFEFPGVAAANDFANSIAMLAGQKVQGGRYTITLDAKPVTVAVFGNVVGVSDRVADLDRTIAVSQGKAASLTAKQLPATMDRGMFLFVVLGKGMLDDVRKAAGSTLLQTEMSAVALDIGEFGGELRARATATMATLDGAQKVKSVLDGLLALAALADENKQFAQITKNVKISISGTTTDVAFAMPTADLVKLLISNNAVNAKIN